MHLLCGSIINIKGHRYFVAFLNCTSSRIKMDSSFGPKTRLFVFFIVILFRSGIGSTCDPPDYVNDCDFATCLPYEVVVCESFLTCRDRNVNGFITEMYTDERGFHHTDKRRDLNFSHAVNSSLVILTSTRFACNGTAGMYLIYGDPDVYVKEMANNQTSNSSYEELGIYKIVSETPATGALDVDYNKHHTYWGVNIRDQGGRLTFWPSLIPDRDITTSNLDRAPVSHKVTGLAVDWISNLLYWSDADYKQIGVIETWNYEKWRTVVDTNLSSPQDVVVYPQQSFLFWCDIGSNPKIEMLDLAQDVRKVLVTSPTVQSPKTLVIDYASLRLYWLDTAKAEVSSVALDGSDYTSWQSNLFSQISSFFLYKEYIVFGDQSKFTIYFHNTTTRQSIFNYTNEALQNISDIVMYEPTRQPDVLSPCKVNNGGCEQFCITISATSRKCQCENGWFLADNGVNCTAKPLMDNYLLFVNSRQKGIYQLDMSTGEVRGVVYDQNIYGTDLDFDPTTNNIYWNDRWDRMFRTNLNTLESTLLARSTGWGVYQFAYDPPSGKIFFINRNYDLQELTFTQPGSVKISDFLKKEVGSWWRAILIDVSKGFLYWSGCGNQSIEMAELSNSSTRETVVSSLTSCVIAMAMDIHDEVIFWADESGTIGSSNLDGSDRRQLYADDSAYITGIACDKSYVYYADYYSRYLHQIDRRTGQKLDLFMKHLFSVPQSMLRYNSSDYPKLRTVLPSSSTPQEHPTTTISGFSIASESSSNDHPATRTNNQTANSGTTLKGCADWTTAAIIIAVLTFRQIHSVSSN